MPRKITYIPPFYQAKAWPDTFTIQSFGDDFENRKQAFFEKVLRNPAPARGFKRAIFEVARLAAGGRLDERVIHESLIDLLEGREDCADFVMQAVDRLLYQFGGQCKTENRRSIFPVLHPPFSIICQSRLSAPNFSNMKSRPH